MHPALLLLALVLSAVPAQPQSTPGPTPAPPAGTTQQSPMPSVHLPEGHSGLTTAINQPDLKTDAAPATSLPPLVPGNRKSIGLVLDGGGALGLAHIGVLKWFEENHIPVDRIAGTSMGSLVGALYATGGSARQLEEIATSSELLDIFHLGVEYNKLGFRRRQDGRELPGALPFGLKDGISLRNAVLTDRGLNAFLHGAFQSFDSKAVRFDQLPIPFRCVATDLNTLRPVVFDGGPVPLAVRASISIPGVFSPVDYHGHYLVDGAIMDNLPVGVAKNDLHADIVIAVELPASSFSENDVGSIVGVFARAFSAGTAANERLSQKMADLVLLPGTAQYGTGDYDKARELIAVGYQSAEAERARLLPYALDAAGWRAYLAAKEARRLPQPGLLQSVQVAGGSPGADAEAARQLERLRGQPIRPGVIVQALNSVEDNRTYEAEFETVPAPGHTANDSGAPGPDTGVLVHLEPTRNGPPFLLVGLDATAATSNVTRTTFDLRLIDNDLGGYGSELRTDVRLGFLTQASTEYYRQLRSNGLFLQPHLGFRREPVYLYADQQRIAERLRQEAGGGLDLGRTFDAHLQLAAEWRAQTIRWYTQTGNDGKPNLSGTAQTGVMHLVYDRQNSGQVSLNGLRVEAAAGILFHSVASPFAPLLTLDAIYTKTLAQKNVLGVSVTANSYLRRNVADPLRFTLGGPLRLSASSVDEFRGTDTGLVRAGYLRRVASLPTQLGEGLYLTTSYEAGEVWSAEQPSFLRQDGVLGLLGATPIGAITLGGSVGDAGRRKIFFTFGRLF